MTPTPTSPPTPAILFFNGNPTTVNEGQDSTLSWQVADSQQVTLQDPDGIPSIQPPTGNLLVRPQKSGNYTLIPGNGAQPQSIYIQVVAATATPTPTPEPDAPVITIFAADKTELVQGKADSGENEKQVELQWVVTGQVTNVELNGGPDIGVFANLNAEGKLPVTISKNTVFVLTAFNQDKTASQSLQVEVLEATPTPEPPPTPVPPPPPAEIEEFVISAPVPPVEIVGSFQYRIPNGTNVIFKWSTKNAAKVTFVPDGGSSQEASPAGQRAEAVTLPVAGLSRTYLLIAENEDGVRTTASIEVSIIDPPTPNAPRSVIGVETVNDKNEIEWQWDSDPNKAAIVGFRLYRAKVPGGSFQQIADEDDLPPGQTKYNDPINPTCGYNYYVVAVYKDVLGNTKETAASSNSWLSTPCP